MTIKDNYAPELDPVWQTVVNISNVYSRLKLFAEVAYNVLTYQGASPRRMKKEKEGRNQDDNCSQENNNSFGPFPNHYDTQRS